MAIKVTWPDIVKLLQQGEGPTLEFIPKVKTSKDLTKVVVSFANGQGGIIVAGVDDKNGHLTGIEFDKDWAATVCKTECEPPVSVQVGEMLRNQKRILVLQVKEGINKPYRTVDGSVLTREGSNTRQASVEEQKKLNPWGVGGINPRQKKALQFISDNGSISNRQYREICDVSHKTAHIELTELVEKNVLVVDGQGRSTVYILAQKDSGTAAVENTNVDESSQELPTDGQLFKFEEATEVLEKGALPKVSKPKAKPVVKKAPKTVRPVEEVKAPIVEEEMEIIDKDAELEKESMEDIDEDDYEDVEELDADTDIEPEETEEAPKASKGRGSPDVTKASFLEL